MQATLFGEQLINKSYLTAINHIKRDVLAGQSLNHIKSTFHFHSSPDGVSVGIGGHLNGELIKNSHIVVYRDEEGKEVNEVFSIEKVFNDIKKGI